MYRGSQITTGSGTRHVLQRETECCGSPEKDTTSHQRLGMLIVKEVAVKMHLDSADYKVCDIVHALTSLSLRFLKCQVRITLVTLQRIAARIR